MVQAHALLVAIALTVTLSFLLAAPAQARSYPCWMVRWYVNSHSRHEVEEMARKHKTTPKERAAAIACLKDKR